jgi:hypothetical protein
MEYIISTLWFVLECVAFFLFASAFLPYRYNGKQTILTALCICTLSLLNQSLTIPSLARRLCALAFGLCLIVFLFKGRLEQRIFIGLLDYIMIAAMDAIILFLCVNCFRSQSGRTGLEKRNVYRAGDSWKNPVRFSGVAYHTITSISSNSPIAPQMDAACQLLSIDKPFYADSVIPDL